MYLVCTPQTIEVAVAEATAAAPVKEPEAGIGCVPVVYLECAPQATEIDVTEATAAAPVKEPEAGEGVYRACTGCVPGVYPSGHGGLRHQVHCCCYCFTQGSGGWEIASILAQELCVLRVYPQAMELDIVESISATAAAFEESEAV